MADTIQQANMHAGGELAAVTVEEVSAGVKAIRALWRRVDDGDDFSDREIVIAVLEAALLVRARAGRQQP